MVTPADFANSKNAWILIYERSILNQFLGLLVEMNTSAIAMNSRYELLKLGETDGLKRDFGFDKEDNMQRHALNGIGAALIIGTNSLLKEIRNNSVTAGATQYNYPSLLIKGVSWEQVVTAAGNYVRHGDEWHYLFNKFCKIRNVPEFSIENRPSLVEEFLAMLEKENTRAFKSIKVLSDFGLNLETHVLVSNRIWDLADQILLTEIEASMTFLRRFIDSFREPIVKRRQ